MTRVLARAGLSLVLSLGAISCSRPSSTTGVEATYDTSTNKLSRLTISKGLDGKPNIFSYLDGAMLLRIEVDEDEDGKIDRWEYYTTERRLEKVGHSRSNDGIADAWAYPGPDGSIARLEISTHRDGRPNRLEFYESGQLARAEEDTNGDGRPDKWETYAAGSLVTVGFDTVGAGTPSRVIDYRSDNLER